MALQRLFACAMLAADPVASGVYYVDDHFVPYTGAKPVAKGWNNKRGRAEKGRADTHVTAHDGRAVCFVTGEPSGLSVTLTKALAELKKAAGPGAAIMAGFDRGGAYPQVFRHCRDQGVHWVTYRRAPLAVPPGCPSLPPLLTAAAPEGSLGRGESPAEGLRRSPADHLVRARQGGHEDSYLRLRRLPVEILSWLKSRWREENFLKYASENYGIDKICDYLASITENTRIIASPARKAATAAVRDAEKTLAAAERELAGLLADPAITPAAKNARIPALQKKITRAAPQRPPPPRPASPCPRSCPLAPSTPTRRPRCCTPGGVACRWPCGCSPTTPSTGYRAISTPT